ncbi:uncharacterized protein CIMG_12743 [Coccidioides immitis RS]|uniref:Uncharacterized protein n=1 Tax=Coccidioides immitis (strain RS) TaxID=246410 RepID=A0A0D8JT29_COCIM|nr:uncharacterized protein CIMG_12743 [Coccidioides immitis RS]KJF60101.1 hypothetical protein CIMG_12743 [Coccidioides immitis RS]
MSWNVRVLSCFEAQPSPHSGATPFKNDVSIACLPGTHLANKGKKKVRRRKSSQMPASRVRSLRAKGVQALQDLKYRVLS